MKISAWENGPNTEGPIHNFFSILITLRKKALIFDSNILLWISAVQNRNVGYTNYVAHLKLMLCQLHLKKKKKKKKKKPQDPGPVAQLVRGSSWYAKVVVSIPSQGTNKNQP